MIVKFEPSGTQIANGRRVIRLDFVPELSDKTYVLHYVQVPDVPPDYISSSFSAPLPAFPLKWQVNPCLSHFVCIPEILTKAILGEWIKQTFTLDIVGALDSYLIRPDSIHWVDPLMRGKWMTQEAVKTKDYAGLIETTKLDFANLVIPLSGGGGKAIIPETITMGAGATDRSTTGTAGYSVLQLLNAATGTGTITSYEIWFNTNATGVKVGVVYLVSGTTYTSRNCYNWGNVSSGSKQTASGLTLSVVTGDLAAFYASSGLLERSDTGGSGHRFLLGEYLDVDDQADYSTFSNGDISLYATGTEAGGLSIPVAMHHRKMLGV